MRYTIIDFMPLVHMYVNGAKPLEYVVREANGFVHKVDTTIPAYTIKHILRCSTRGANPTAVCLDCGSTYRRDYFSQGFKGEVTEYKGGRKPLYSATKQGADLTINLLCEGKVSCYRRYGYEADDWIYTLVQNLKEQGVTAPIDIFTNDRDMLPLVDEQVSVYIRSQRQYNELDSPSVSGYFQVTPQSMEMYCQYSSEYRNYGLTYNAILLYKLIKGDKSDNIPMAVKGYGAKTFFEFMQTLKADGVDIPNIFRYGVDFDTVIRPVMSKYFTEEQVDKMAYIYGGINLRRVPPLTESGFKPPMPIRIDTLQILVGNYGIDLGKC